jgi:hypothetical protein
MIRAPHISPISLNSISIFYISLQSKIELDKRDRLIGKYEKYYRQLKRDAERRETERRGGVPGPEYEKHAPSNLTHAPTSSSAPPPQPSAHSLPSQSTTGGKINPPVSSNTANIALSSSGNAQRQQPRAPSMVARNKHPSISTLETTLGLQRDRAGASGVRYAHSGGHK